MEYHATVNKYAMELLEEKRKQDQLQAQIRCLKELHLNQKEEIPSQVVNVGEVLQSLHSDAEVAFETTFQAGLFILRQGVMWLC